MRLSRPLAGLLLGGLLLSACASNDDATATAAATTSSTAVTVTDVWMREPANPDVAGVFLTLANTGDEDVALVGGDTDIADIVEVHETVMEDGNMAMRHLPAGVTVPSGETLVLKPGGYHIMLRKVTAPPAAGDTVALQLTFDDATTLDVSVPVLELTAEGPAGPADES